jgi:hypothetical protein
MGTDATGFKGEHFDKCNREGSEGVDAMCCKNCAFMKIGKRFGENFPFPYLFAIEELSLFYRKTASYWC